MNFEELSAHHEKTVLGLQYTIAQRERLRVLMKMAAFAINSHENSKAREIIDFILNTPAERAQDVFAYIFSGCKRNGFFVEFGACDGLAVSNTLALEKRFDWNGILAEPSKLWRDRLPLNRSASIDLRCVAGETGLQVNFFESDSPGNSSSQESHKYLGSVTESYSVETVSLLDLLSYHSAPDYIDYLSVDTEGSEKEILEWFDFSKYKFGFISVEEHEDVSMEESVQPILERAGYEIILAREQGRPVPMQISGVDKFFVPVGHPATKWGLG